MNFAASNLSVKMASSSPSSFGVKLGSYPKDVLMLNAQRAAQAKMMEIDSNITKLKREFQRNGIDEADFREKVDQQIAKKQKVVEDLQKRMAGGLAIKIFCETLTC